MKEMRNGTETADEVVRDAVAGSEAQECWAEALGSKWQPGHFHGCLIGEAGVKNLRDE